jgi:hypothetical protein
MQGKQATQNYYRNRAKCKVGGSKGGRSETVKGMYLLSTVRTIPRLECVALGLGGSRTGENCLCLKAERRESNNVHTIILTSSRGESRTFHLLHRKRGGEMTTAM